MNSNAKSRPPVEAFANGAHVWLAKPNSDDWWAHLDTPEEVDELIAALEIAKAQAWPHQEDDTH